MRRVHPAGSRPGTPRPPEHAASDEAARSCHLLQVFAFPRTISTSPRPCGQNPGAPPVTRNSVPRRHVKNWAMPSGSLVFSSDVVYHGMSQEARQSWVNQAQEKLLLRKINLPTGTSIRSEQYFLISCS